MLRAQETVPLEAVTVAVSLDGVMVPMKDGGRAQKRDEAKAQGKHTCGPAGHSEVGCGTLSFYDAEGDRLSTVRMARMPESHKASLKTMLTQEIETVLSQRPDLTLVKLADGARDNWTYLSTALPPGVELVDFYHACEHLKKAFDAAYGENSSKSKAQFEKYRYTVRDEPAGVEKIIRALAHLRDSRPRKKKLATELAYFRRHRHRMHYAEAQAQNLPLGSGVVEAACKTLATQRMKRSGMRWRHRGGQAILTSVPCIKVSVSNVPGTYYPAPTNVPSRSRKTSCCFLNEPYIDVSVSELHPTTSSGTTQPDSPAPTTPANNRRRSTRALKQSSHL